MKLQVLTHAGGPSISFFFMNRAQMRPIYHLHMHKLQDSVRYHRKTVTHEKSSDFVVQCIHFVEVTLLLAADGDIGPSNVSL